MSGNRCTVTELIVDQCDHCRPAPTADVFDQPLDRGPWFMAMFPGTCSDCAGEFDEGQQIRADGEGGYLCGICGAV